MPVRKISMPHEVFGAIETEKPTIIHYWPPHSGPESPFTPIFEHESHRLEGLVSFYIVYNGFIHPEFRPDQMPLTVWYDKGQTKGSAPMDADEVRELIQKAARGGE